MRILQISSASSFGGGERYLVDLSNSLCTRGHDVFVAVRPKSPIVDYLKLPAQNIQTFPLRNALDAQSARALARFVKENKIDVVHAHMARDYSLAAYAARVKPQPMFIVTRHVLFPLSGIHRRTLSRATKLIAVSSAVAGQLKSQRLVPDDRIATVPNGIDVDRYSGACQKIDRSAFLKSKGLPTDCLIVGSIGELRKLKRHDDLIRAASLIVREVQNTHFVIAGVDTSAKSEIRSELKELVGKLQLQDRVHFLGWLDDAEKLLCAIDVFVSASETESFGLSIAEAMAAGTAVVATQTEGAQEVVDTDSTGLLVPIGDVAVLSASIVRLLRDESLRKAIGNHAADVVKERFSLQRMVDEIEEIYLEGKS